MTSGGSPGLKVATAQGSEPALLTQESMIALGPQADWQLPVRRPAIAVICIVGTDRRLSTPHTAISPSLVQ